MPKSELQKKQKNNSSAKNIYAHKINSISKLVGSHLSLPELKNSRRTLSFDSRETWLLQRKESNKDAARKARLRKKVYMDMLEQAVEKLKFINDESKGLEESSSALLFKLNSENEIECKKQDQISKYLMQLEEDRVNKDSIATMDMERQYELLKLTGQIQKISFPSYFNVSKLEGLNPSLDFLRKIEKIGQIQNELPDLFHQLKNICQDHASLSVLSYSLKDPYKGNPYICKTLLEQYYSKTICRKNIKNTVVEKYLEDLQKLDLHIRVVKKIIQQ